VFFCVLDNYWFPLGVFVAIQKPCPFALPILPCPYPSLPHVALPIFFSLPLLCFVLPFLTFGYVCLWLHSVTVSTLTWAV